ncbi:hypothetical protein Q1Z72_01860 [Pseudomonas qingdaonensis]|uniref:pPIWI-associating nuclease domain-containing protein n=1 Tax=Pseudomonas qingdaonensis TaxID=2056231 RepID=UPI0021F1E175|nr:hypothetical protein [Pseudomonas qingdaonensis]WKL67441.1 hypothetical protein Q1Z72_01860 [Pseudomonas qingdaonensis]
MALLNTTSGYRPGYLMNPSIFTECSKMLLFPTLICGNMVATSQPLADCLREGKVDQRIVNLVAGSSFEHSLYQAALQNLSDTGNQLRFNNFAYAMRELSRHFLHRLAPDAEVVKCPWYKNITQAEGKIARSERAAYAVHGGLSEEYVDETLGLDIDEMNKRLKVAIDGLSRYTHIQEDVFGLPAEQVEVLAQETTESFAGLFDAIKRCHNDIVYKLHLAIDDAAVEEVLRDTIQAIDELATHHFIDEICVDETSIRITHDTVHFSVAGTVGVELQYGSNSDWRNGDGTKIDVAFPFSCQLTCPAAAPSENTLRMVQGSLAVDTSRWYDSDEEKNEEGDSDPQAEETAADAEQMPARPADNELF